MKRIFLPALLLACLTAPLAQEINFTDLKRPGRPMEKSYTVPGLASEGNTYISRYSEVDDYRVESNRRAMAAAAPAVSAAQQQNSKAGERGKTFQCKIYCESASGPVIYRQITAATRADAARLAGDESMSLCRSDGYRKSSNAAFSPSQCTEQ